MNKEQVLEAIDQVVELNVEAANTFTGIIARNNDVLRRLSSVLAEPDPVPVNDLLTYTEAAKYLNIPRGSLYQLKHTGRIGCIQMGRKVLFERAELDQMLQMNRIPRKLVR